MMMAVIGPLPASVTQSPCWINLRKPDLGPEGKWARRMRAHVADAPFAGLPGSKWVLG